LKKAILYGHEETERALFVAGKSNTSGKVKVADGDEDTVQVSTTTISQILSENSVDEYCLVSDIEGAEAGIAFSDVQALVRCRQIIIELHETMYKNRALSVDDLSQAFEDLHGFSLRARYGRVHMFERTRSLATF
jgi:hypothetical protein